jgi:hypothetical protein
MVVRQLCFAELSFDRSTLDIERDEILLVSALEDYLFRPLTPPSLRAPCAKKPAAAA